MRKWYKYYIDCSRKGVIQEKIDETFSDHKKGMGGYNSDEFYSDKDSFFKHYFWGYHCNRLEYYYDFITNHLEKERIIFSVASGRCTLELKLIDEGYFIKCSDLDMIDCYNETKKLFPDFELLKHNILESPTLKTYDAFIVMSLIYLFDNGDLSTFFRNVYDSLDDKGVLILDSAGSPDNFISFLVHEVILKFETIARRIIKYLLEKKMYGFVIKHFGYQRNDREIIRCAHENGFELELQQNYSLINDFQRSGILRRLINLHRIFEIIFMHIGKHYLPYIRMYRFKKIERPQQM
ncbi:MAG: hypothetical protein AB2L14_31665 [Candidatus Xenobiia bacterium LiM19]